MTNYGEGASGSIVLSTLYEGVPAAFETIVMASTSTLALIALPVIALVDVFMGYHC